ncbi:sortase-dependent protein [Streptomyces sp. NPDC049687]|uniref:sortase-dependent protein n=1 Tax=Streptomyces sp. NPDC049687 TaxID=3365596 RepID=UPI0037B4E063
MRLMSRTGLGALAVTGTALLMSAAPAFAADQSASPVPSVAEKTDATGLASEDSTKAPAEDSSTAPSAVPSQVGEVPRGAADTGVEKPSEGNGGLIGAGSAAAFAVAGAGFYVVRRRRATGA